MVYKGWTNGCDKTWRYIWAPPIRKRWCIDELVDEDEKVSLLGLNENASSMLDTLNAFGESLLQANQYQVYHEKSNGNETQVSHIQFHVVL